MANLINHEGENCFYDEQDKNIFCYVRGDAFSFCFDSWEEQRKPSTYVYNVDSNLFIFYNVCDFDW